ncbi:hypothetical protein [Moritella sp.]|uniref:hypothetical protein n=1 Tax=Moritella sp. TaxID=78556 RepID=UPI001E1A0A02|nr:hypothetical protein [Moritella sp.]MCJ8348537.1 hypothetical protein [Moritella sp.]NQZ39052.1 hypothetical protein [Moritella sp.]
MNIFCKVINKEAKEEKSESCESKKIENSISDQDLQRLYAVEFKSQSYSSFYNTTMEKDKSILTLSVAGIGFLITLLKLSDSLEYYDMIFFSVAILGFLISIFCIISLFGKNADFIVDLAQEKDVKVKQHVLKQLDSWAIRTFYLAIIMSVCLGVSTSSTLFVQGEKEMTKDININNTLETSAIPTNESFTQAVDLTKSYQQATSLSDSFQGAASLQSSTHSQAAAQSNNTGAAAMMPNTNSEKE